MKALYVFLFLLTVPVMAGEPNGVVNCGFSYTNAAAKGATRGILGIGADCLLWGCIPILSLLGVASAVAEEIDVDCAGTVWQGIDTAGRYQYMITWNSDSKAEAERSGREYCVRQGFRQCRQRLVFRHAAAVHQPRFGTYAQVAQAGDIPTAKELSFARCRRATGESCQLVFAKANRH